MNVLAWSVLIVILVGVVIITVEFLIPQVIVLLGQVDSWWSPFRTLPPPGEMYILVRGSKSGPFDKIIESVPNYDYDQIAQEFYGPVSTRMREDYLSNIGVVWIGFFRYLFYREVRHDKWEKLPNSANWGLVSKIRPGPSIFFRYNMAVEIKGAETVGNFPVDAVIVFTVQVMNPVKAFFFAGGWEVQTTAAVQGKFRKYVSDKRIEELRQEQKAGTDTLVTTEIKTLSRIGPDGSPEASLYTLFGVEIIDARFVLFDLVSGDEDMTRAVRALEIATLNADASAKDGDGERRKRENRAAGVRAEVEAWGAHTVGGTVAMAEAIKEAKPKVLGGNIVAGVDTK
ncbi:MAG: hypothetical protein AAB586_01795 [Patescibacteria group bacterium]